MNHRSVKGLIVACLFSPAWYLSASPFASEVKFLEHFGERATQVADGVYELRSAGDRVRRVSFGLAGIRFDRVAFEKELLMLEKLGGDPNFKARAGFRTELNGLLDTLQASEVRIEHTAQRKAGFSGMSCGREVEVNAIYADGWTQAGAFSTVSLELDQGGPAWPPSYEWHLYSLARVLAPNGSTISFTVDEKLAVGNQGASTSAVEIVGWGHTCTLVAYSAFTPLTEDCEFFEGEPFVSLTEQGPCV